MQTANKSVASVLNNVHVAAPCGESWEAMPGGERVRSCDRCKHKVYNLSEMTADEAAQLLTETEGRLCVRFYRRADGTMLTKDCPVGVRAVRQRIARATTVGFTSLAVACGTSFMGRPRAEQPRLVQWIMNKISPEPAPPVPDHTMGAVAFHPLPMAPPTPAVMGTPAPPRITMGEMTMGKPVMGARTTSQVTMGQAVAPKR